MLSRGTFGYFQQQQQQQQQQMDNYYYNNNNNESNEQKREKSTRRRAKFIRKVTCNVCGDIANDHIHYGAVACYSCRAFFRRAVNCHAQYQCSRDQVCVVTKETRKHCQYCRFQKCLLAGMKSSWVMSEAEKIEKREKALFKKLNGKSSSTVKRKRNKRIRLFRKRGRRGYNGDDDEDDEDDEEGEEEEDEELISAPSVIKKEENATVEDFGEICSEVASPSSPLETLDEISCSPLSATSSALAVAAAVKAVAGRRSPANMDIDFPFTIEENALVKNMIFMECQSRQLIPVKMETMVALAEAAKFDRAIPFEIAVDGYNTCIQRIIKFVTQLDMFSTFSEKDQRSLLLNNADMIVNIKTARFLRPGNNLRTQLACVSGNESNLASSSSSNDVNNNENRRLEYNQVFLSPWCCSFDDELKYLSLMKDIFHLEMDEVTCVLLVAMTVFSSNNCNKALSEAKRSNGCQEFFSQMLYRYLCSTIGKSNAVKLFPKYVQILAQLEEMARILIHKRLPF